MKRLFIFMTGILGLGLASCQQIAIDSVDPGTFKVTVRDDRINTGLEESTRATVDAATGETNINSLYLLFFGHSEDGSGIFVQAEEIDNPAMNMQRNVSFSGINTSSAYTILAIANFEGYVGDMNTFLNDLTGKSERAVLERTVLAVAGEPGNNELTDSQAIPSTNLPMSVRLVKAAGESDITVNLVRGVARFDVYNNPNDQYDLVSVSIWNASKTTPGWKDVSSEAPDKTERFYGVKQDREIETAGTEGNPDLYKILPNIVGGLYSFESVVGSPVQNDNKTTCLIIGMVPRHGSSLYDDALTGSNQKIHYYRVNVHPEDLAQSLKRNYVYKVTIRSVGGEGYGSEGDAWAGADTRLVVNINNWDLDDEGIIQTNGTSTLAIPVKKVRLNPDGDEREYSIFTMGPGTLSMHDVDLPSGITVTLNTETKTMRVIATEMAADESERKGSVTISFAGMSGTITFIQNESSDKYLNLNRYNLPSFPSFGISGISDGGYIQVLSSGPWEATLYNVSNADSDTNDRFSFSASGNQSTLTRATNGGTDQFSIYSRVDNEKTEVRYSFVTISLIGDPDINRTLILVQKRKTELAVTPSVKNISFDPIGKPLGTPAVEGAVAGSPLRFSVNPGSTESDIYGWKAVLSGDDAQYFDLVMYDGVDASQSENVQGMGKFEIKAKGTDALLPGDYSNYLGRTLSATVTITHLSEGSGTVSSGTVETMNLTQLPAGLEVSSGNRIVSVKGGYAEDITVTVPSGMTWSAEIVSNNTTLAAGDYNGTDWAHHTAYILDSDNALKTKVENKSTSVKLRIGYDKIYYPMIDFRPTATVKIWVHQLGSDVATLTETIEISQNELTPLPINLFDSYTSTEDWGSIHSEDYGLNGFYRRFILNRNLFGVNGVVKTQNDFAVNSYQFNTSRASATAIDNSVNFFQAGGRKALWYANGWSAVGNWWTNKDNDAVTVWTEDNEGVTTTFTNSNSIANKVGFKHLAPSSIGITTNLAVTDQTKRIVKYLRKDGPFTKLKGEVTAAMGFFSDGFRNGVDPAQYDGGKVSVITNTGTTGAALCAIDVKNRVVFIGEIQMFSTYTDDNRFTTYTSVPSMTSASTFTNHDRWLCNLLSYMVMTAQYGSHFSDLFIDTGVDGSPSIDRYNQAFEVTP